MAAKVSEVKAGLGAKYLGKFHVEKFNLFDPDDASAYADLRTRANDASSGITIEQIREYSRKSVNRDIDPDGHEHTSTIEEIFLVVQYWEKKPRSKKGESDESLDEKLKVAQLPGRR